MKNTKKILSMVLALMMLVSALSISASASSVLDVDPNYQPEQFVGLISREEVLAKRGTSLLRLYESSTCFIPYNPGSGTTGEIAVEFVADGSKAEFTLDCKYDGDYNCQLYRVNTSGDTKVGSAVISSFGFGPTFKNLVIGATYYIKVSSQSVPTSGATGTYTLDVT